MKRLKSILLLSFLTIICRSQGTIGSWTDHLSYSSSLCLARGDGKIFSSTGNSVMILDINSKKTEKLSRVNGLTETEISAIAFSDEEKCLIVAYSNTNVDIVTDKIITNIPDIKRKYISGLKEINRIRINGHYAYLASSFGIVIIDLENKVITDTWKPGANSDINEVFDVTFYNGQIYAATVSGIYHAPLSKKGLSYFENWETLNSLPAISSGFQCIATAEQNLFTGFTDETSGSSYLYKIDPSGDTVQSYVFDNETIKSIESGGSEITVATGHSVLVFSGEGNLIKSVKKYSWGGTPDSRHAITTDGKTWIADKSVGLVSTSNFSDFSNYTLDGPYTSNVADIHIAGNKVFITGGSVTNAWANVYRPFQLFAFDGGNWNDIIYWEPADKDAMRVVSDPNNNNHIFVSSWGNGIYELRDGNLVKNYNQYNSPLSSIIPNEPYSRVCGIAFDRKNNLWVTQSGVPENLKMLKPDGSWVITKLSVNVETVGDMLIDSRGFIWIILPRGNGLVVYDPGKTPDDINDDRYMPLQVRDNDNEVLTNIFSIAEDHDGNIWVGTDAGPVVYFAPEKVFSENLKATRIKVPRNDGSGLADYLLGTETITAIAIDGDNRKWFGTLNSGAYLVSGDGLTQISHFTMENSPLYSDQIVRISVNGNNGEVWIGTASGLISFRGDATSANSDYSKMYAFPNPVREDYEGVVTVTGLVENSSVKITDISGNLVFEETSKGGQITWDLNNYKGKRVSTGVYLVFVASKDGTFSAVTKILIIR